MAYRSFAAPWIGGAADGPAPVSAGGYRSFLAFWAGGATGVAPAPAGGGYRSLLALWIGGAADGEAREVEAGGGKRARGSREEFEPTRRRRTAAGVLQEAPAAAAVAPAATEVTALLKALAIGAPAEQFEAFVGSLRVAGLVSAEEAAGAQAARGAGVGLDRPVAVRMDNRLRIILAYWALS